MSTLRETLEAGGGEHGRSAPHRHLRPEEQVPTMSFLSKMKERAARPPAGTVARGLYELDALGGMAGKTEMDFVRAMGCNPVAITEIARGQRLLQWTSGRLEIQRIAVVFDAAHCFVKVASRYQV